MTRAISTSSRRQLSSSIYLKGNAPKEIQAILTETLGEQAPSYATVKNWVGQFQLVIFPPVLRLVLDDPKQWPPQEIVGQIRWLILEDRQISAK